MDTDEPTERIDPTEGGTIPIEGDHYVLGDDGEKIPLWPICMRGDSCWKCGKEILLFRDGVKMWWVKCTCGNRRVYQSPKENHPRCPLCNTALIIGPDECYETLTEHVMDVNGERPMRPTWRCPSKKCKDTKTGFWGMDGSWYGKHKRTEPDRLHKEVRYDWGPGVPPARFTIEEEVAKSSRKRKEEREKNEIIPSV